MPASLGPCALTGANERPLLSALELARQGAPVLLRQLAAKPGSSSGALGDPWVGSLLRPWGTLGREIAT